MSDFRPSWRSPPGDTVRDLMAMHDTTPEHLAVALGLTDPEAFLRGDVTLTREHAYALSLMYGPSPEFWIKREADYREPVETP